MRNVKIWSRFQDIKNLRFYSTILILLILPVWTRSPIPFQCSLCLTPPAIFFGDCSYAVLMTVPCSPECPCWCGLTGHFLIWRVSDSSSAIWEWQIPSVSVWPVDFLLSPPAMWHPVSSRLQSKRRGRPRS